METRMTSDERQAFLAETRVGIISIPEEGRGPLTVPVWYSYTPGGEVCVWTSANSRKARLLKGAKRISFCVQDPTPPNYKYVSIEGPFTITAVDLERDIHPLAIRYYGPKDGEQYYEDVSKGDSAETSIIVRIHPEHWFSADYSKVS